MKSSTKASSNTNKKQQLKAATTCKKPPYTRKKQTKTTPDEKVHVQRDNELSSLFSCIRARWATFWVLFIVCRSLCFVRPFVVHSYVLYHCVLSSRLIGLSRNVTSRHIMSQRVSFAKVARQICWVRNVFLIISEEAKILNYFSVDYISLFDFVASALLYKSKVRT